MPNLMKLGIRIESPHGAIETFSFFDEFTSLYKEFESFKCIVANPSIGSPIASSIPNFPVNIKKINLRGCGFPWEYMRVIGALPNLLVLKLRCYAFCGPVWKPSEEEFPKLEFLLLEDLDLRRWEACYFNFFKLERLIIRHCYRLQVIGSDIGLMGDHKLIEVDDCSPLVGWEIQDGLELLGKKSLQFRLHFSGMIRSPLKNSKGIP